MRFIHIKNISSLAVFTLTLIACNSKAYISGKLEGVDDETTKIYLIRPDNLREVAASYFGKVIDSAVVQPDGGFEFVNLQRYEEPVFFEIAVHQPGKFPNYLNTENPVKSNFMPILWQPGETLKIKADFNEFQNSFSVVNPSEINRALLNLRNVNQDAYQTYLEGKEWHVEDGKQLMAKEHAVLAYRKELMEFADRAQHFVTAMVALRLVSPEDDYERVPEFLVRQCEKWRNIEPNHPWAKELCEQGDPSKLPVLEGDVFPDQQLPMITKDTLFLKDQLGKKLTIVDLWASWCAPCRLENREVLSPIWDEYKGKGLQIVAYGLESNESAWKRAVDHDGADRWLQASDLQGDETPFLKRIRVNTIPANFILDEKGVVLAKNVHGKELQDWVKRYMDRK